MKENVDKIFGRKEVGGGGGGKVEVRKRGTTAVSVAFVIRQKYKLV